MVPTIAALRYPSCWPMSPSIFSPGTVAPTRPSWKNGGKGAVFARMLVASVVDPV